jgi:hypothetical protein
MWARFPPRKGVQRICRAISDETGRETLRLDPKAMVGKLNRMLIGWANYFCLGKPTVRSIYTPAAGCVGGSATNTRKRGRVINAFRKRLFILCTLWCSYHTVLRAFRGANA